MEGLTERCVISEIDPDVAAFWKAALCHNDELTDRVRTFVPTRESVAQLDCKAPGSVVERGFRTLVLNRTRRGGILANGASLARAGEAGKGVTSRWYPDTISRRLKAISDYADRIEFLETDGLEVLQKTTRASVSRTVVLSILPILQQEKAPGNGCTTTINWTIGNSSLA